MTNVHSARRRVNPGFWNITANDGTTLDATNSVTGEVFQGTPQAFATMLRSEVSETTPVKVYPVIKILGNENITAGVAHVESTAIDAETVRIVTQEDIYIEVGENPVATTDSPIMLANSLEYFQINRGDKVSVLQVNISGKVSVAPVQM
jgi:hypothetical protein